MKAATNKGWIVMHEYKVYLTETITRTAEMVIEVADNQDSSDAERIAKDRIADAKWNEPVTTVKISGWRSFLPPHRIGE